MQRPEITVEIIEAFPIESGIDMNAPEFYGTAQKKLSNTLKEMQVGDSFLDTCLDYENYRSRARTAHKVAKVLGMKVSTRGIKDPDRETRAYRVWRVA
jgi:purine-nucleoside phosphorylase